MNLKIPKLSPRTVLFSLLTLVMLSIALRYPHTSHQIGADGFFNNTMARIIIQDGHANWILSPFSYMGLGPFSYPAAIHFILATISQLTNSSTYVSVIYFNFILGICGTLFSFMMVKELTHSNEIALLSSFIFSTSPEFLWLTTWNNSSRPMVMVFFLLLVYFLFKTEYAKRAEPHTPYIKETFTFLTLFLLLMITTMHRMWIFSMFIGIGFIMSRPIYWVKRLIKREWGILKKKKHTIVTTILFLLWAIFIIMFIITQLSNMGFYEGKNLWWKYQTGLFFSGNSIEILFMNMLVDYWSGWGVISVFCILGAFITFKMRNKKYSEVFLLSSILFIAPLLTLGLYTKLIMLLFITPLAAIGILWIITHVKKIKRIALPLLLTFLMISIIFNMGLVNHWQNQSGIENLKDTRYDVGMYMNTYLDENDTFITNNQVFGNQVLMMADCKFLTERFLYPVVYGWIEKEDLNSLLDWKTMIDDYTIEVYYPEEYMISMDHRFIITHDIEQSNFERSKYNVNYALENPVSTTNYYIQTSIHATKYKIFDNSDGTVWYLG